MEVDAIVEIFKQSEMKYGVKYTNYIEDGDSKTYSGVLEASPYENTIINKKECIEYLQKRMGSQLRILKTKHSGLGLTGKMRDELTVYYGLAIHRHCDSLENMKIAIWATFYHYSSTNKKPHHEMCPKDEDSWCSYQHAEANRELDSYKQDYRSLPSIVMNAIKPIYEDLSNDSLL